jgi:hypothetical protein
MSDERNEAVRERVEELVRGWLDRADEWWPDGFQVREIGIAWGVDLPEDQDIVSTSSTAGTSWEKAGLFRAALLVTEQPDDD